MPGKLSRRLALQLGTAALPLGAYQKFYSGKDEPLPKQIALAAGRMTMVFEPDLGFLRYLRFGNAEILRGVYAAVRDRNWGTVSPQVGNVKVESGDGGFKATFDVTCKQGNIDFFWRGILTGEARNRVRFAMEGEARSTFLRNRIGFAVLHPITECAGNWCTVYHGDGSKEQGKFPFRVSPHQPFKDMASVSHQVAPGVMAHVRFEGETFEMEDHRNWTDASYKTYCTPLAKPFPVEVPQGAKIMQSVTVELEGVAPETTRRFVISRRAVELAFDTKAAAVPLPKIGLGFSGGKLSANAARRIAALKPAHLRVEGVKAAVEGVPSEVALHLTGDGETDLNAAAEAAKSLKIARWVIYHKDQPATDPKWIRLAKQRLSGVPVGGGTNAYFAELNRARPDPSAFDFLCYSLNPQVHAFDNTSLVENVAAQADAVLSAKQFSGGKPIVITPVTLLPRFNPNATEAVSGPAPADPRQDSLFGAAWTLGSLKYLGEAGTGSVTYYEAAGPGGVLAEDRVYPLYHVLQAVTEFAGGEVLPVRSNQPLTVDAMALRLGSKTRVLVANMTAEAQTARLSLGNSQKRLTVRRLDEYSIQQATQAPEAWKTAPADTLSTASSTIDLALAPYAVVWLDA